MLDGKGGRAISSTLPGSEGHLWDIETGRSLTCVGEVCTAAVRETTLVSGTREGLLLWRDLRGRDAIRMGAHQGEVSALAMRGNLIVTGSEDGRAKLWDVRTMAELSECIMSSPVTSVAISRRNDVAIGMLNGSIKYNDEAKETRNIHGAINCMSFCRNSLILGHDDGTIHRIDITTNDIFLLSETFGSAIVSVHGHRDKLVAGHADGLITIHNLVRGHSDFIADRRGIIWQIYADEGRILSSSLDHKLLVHDFRP